MRWISSKKFWWILFGLHVVLRLPTLWTTILNIDESQFSLFAHTLMDGGLPYVQSVDTKPLGMYWYFAFCFKIFGRYSMFGVHLVTLLWSFVTPFFLHQIFTLYRKPDIGRISAVLFVVFSVGYLPEFLATSIVNVMLPWLVMSMYFVLKAHHAVVSGASGRVWRYDALAGLILGIAFLFKYQAGIQTVHFFILSLMALRHTRRFGTWFWRNCIFGLAFLLPLALHSLYVYRLGVWPDFVMWMQANKHYVSYGMATSSFWRRLVFRVGVFAGCTFAIWFLAAKAVFHKWQDSTFAEFCRAHALWFVLSFLAVSVGGRFYPHYFLQILPALSALGALGVAFLSKGQKRFVVVFSVVSMLVFLGLRFNHRLYFKYFPDDELYQQEEIGLKIKDIANPDDTLFVWGFATAIYFYAEVEPASRFLWCDWLVARPLEKGAPLRITDDMRRYLDRNWQMLWQDLTTAQPRFFVDTSVAGYHMYEPFQIKNYPELFEYVTTHYRKRDQIQDVDIYERLDAPVTAQ